MSINYERLGDKLRQIRSDRNYSQEALAEATNLTRESITRIENGSMKPKLETIADIADANDCGECHTWDQLIDAIRELFEIGDRVPVRKEN